MTIGEKIKKYRLKKKLSQKQLAVMTGMSEPAIRNYELGNRTPSDTQLEKISGALGISLFSLAEPNFDSYISVMHSLFALEDDYGLHAAIIDGTLCMRFTDKGMDSHTMMENIEKWADVYEKYRTGEITEEYYQNWKANYPKVSALEAKKELDSLRQKRNPKS